MTEDRRTNHLSQDARQQQAAREQATQQLLQQAMQEHALGVEPSADAFFRINQRIARKEERLSWMPENIRSLRLQPSMVASIVLLIALSVVTTLLVTRENSSSQVIRSAEPTPTTATEPPPTTAEPTPTTASVPTTTPANEPAQTGNGEVVVVSEPAPNAPPASTPQTEPPVSAPEQTEPAPVPETTTTTEPEEVPSLVYPETYEVRPLQAALFGPAYVYAQHRTDSEVLATIPVIPEAGADPYLTTGVVITDHNGEQWGEIAIPAEEPTVAWVRLKTVALIPSPMDEILRVSLINAAHSVLSVVTANEAEENAVLDSATLVGLSNSVPVSSRGVYVSAVSDGATAAYARYPLDEFQAAFGQDDSSISSISSLYDELACLSADGNTVIVSGEDSGIAPATALQVLTNVAIYSSNPDNDCQVLVYFDFLTGQPEIIGFSTH